MTRSLLGLLALTALPAWAEQPKPEVLTPYETVVERPLETTGPFSSSSLGVSEASGQSAVAPTAGAQEVTAYEAALSNAKRSTTEQPDQAAQSTPELAVEAGEPVESTPDIASPWAEAIAAKAAGPDAAVVGKPLALAVPAEPVVEPVAPVPIAAAPIDSAQQRPFTPPGGVDVPSSQAVVAREQGRRSRREQRTVFGPRRHTRFLGLYAGGSLGAPGFGGPSSGAIEAGAIIGGSLRLGAEFRGLSYGRSGPDVRLASSGFVLGWAFKTRSMIHPTADVVLGAGVVSHSNGNVIGGVGLTAVRGGAELNLTRSVRLTASVGWRGIAAPNREVRRDLDGLEGLVGVRVGWF